MKLKIVVCKLQNLLFGNGLNDSPITGQQIFRLVQTESLCRRKNKCNLKTETLFEMGRKHREENIDGSFSTMFSKGFGVVKCHDCVVKT